jgi:hypothetical protein
VAFGSRASQTQLALFEKQKKRGIWLKIPIERSAWIAAAAGLGFEFHHAKPQHVGGKHRGWFGGSLFCFCLEPSPCHVSVAIGSVGFHRK